jgi:hypothetical protein
MSTYQDMLAINLKLMLVKISFEKAVSSIKNSDLFYTPIYTNTIIMWLIIQPINHKLSAYFLCPHFLKAGSSAIAE